MARHCEKNSLSKAVFCFITRHIKELMILDKYLDFAIIISPLARLNILSEEGQMKRFIHKLATLTMFYLFTMITACDTYNQYYMDKDAIDTDVAEVTMEHYDSTSLPECNSFITLQNQDNDLLWTDGTLFYFEVTPDQRNLADAMLCQNRNYNMNVYDLDNGDSSSSVCPNSADNVRVVPYGQKEGNIVCTDTGKVALDTVGQSSFRLWREIPNFRLNVSTFNPDQSFPENIKNIRFNNGQAESTILREPIALKIWREMGYPAPRSSFAQVRTNVWDTEFHAGAWSGYVLREQYKSAFFQSNNISVVSVWEGWGDIFANAWAGECKWSQHEECDDEQLTAIVDSIHEVPIGDGFMRATENVIDWPAIHQFQCLSALTGTGDDWIHNQNNVILILRSDGKLMFLPYSVDISADHPWYQDVAYDGFTYLPDACRQDFECRSLALITCKDMINRFEALDVPTTIVDERWEALQRVGLNRSPDKIAYKKIRTFYEEKPQKLRAEINSLIWKLIAERNSSSTPTEEPKF
jgi:hypothetical protein